jgi:3-dehydroquinate synthase
MGMDKKVLGGRIRLVLLHGLGKAAVTADYDPDALAETLLEHFGAGAA